MAQVAREPRRIAQLYDLTADYIASSVCGMGGGEQPAGTAEVELVAETRQAERAAPSVGEDAGDGDGDEERHTCNTCEVAFENLREQRAHYKTDWHRLNVKRRSSQRAPLSEAAFENAVEDGDDVSSISGSDTVGALAREVQTFTDSV
eukprot:1181648-Prorocentrum_minimum.AAC.2